MCIPHPLGIRIGSAAFEFQSHFRGSLFLSRLPLPYARLVALRVVLLQLLYLLCFLVTVTQFAIATVRTFAE